MNESSYFKFLATDVLVEMERIYVIVTADYKENSNNLYSEYFIFLETDKKMLATRYISHPLEFYDLKIDLSFMEKQAIIGAEGSIDNYVYEKFKENNFDVYLNQNYSLKEWNWIPLIKIIKGGIFYKDIENLRSNTKCISLKEFIDKVRDLEIFRFETLDLYN